MVSGKTFCISCNFSLTILIGYNPLPILMIMRKRSIVCALFLHTISILHAEKLWLLGNYVRKKTLSESLTVNTKNEGSIHLFENQGYVSSAKVY
jgi:hypothetical protein